MKQEQEYEMFEDAELYASCWADETRETPVAVDTDDDIECKSEPPSIVKEEQELDTVMDPFCWGEDTAETPDAGIECKSEPSIPAASSSSKRSAASSSGNLLAKPRLGMKARRQAARENC